MNKIIDIKNYIIVKFKKITIRKSWLNAALRDSIIAALTILAISCTTGYIVYIKAAADLKKETQNNLLNIARSASEFLDGDAHQKITRPEDFGTTFYEEVRAPFFKLLRANSNIKFIYTVIKLNDKYYFILDSSIPKPGEVYNPSKVMTEYTEASETLKQAIEQQAYKVEQEPYTDEYGTFLSSYVPIYNSKKEFLGVVGSDISIKDFLDSTARLKRSLLLGTLIGTLASIVIGFAIWLMRQKAITAEKINKEQQLQMLLMEQDRIKAEHLQKTTSENRRQNELNQIATDFEQTVQKVVELVVVSSDQLRADAEKVANIAKDAKKRSSEVADNSLKTAQISEEVSLSASELTSSINKISEQTSKSRKTAYEATTRAKSAKEILELLSIKSTNIGKIVSVINGITRQINLLALNATIESARAGESGKGFAIVAHEIKDLAEQVKSATNEISKQILTMQDATHQSVDSVMNIITTIEEASENAYIVASAVEEQSAVTNKIAKNITMTASGAKNISSNIALVENGADEVGQTANKLLNSAISLDEQSTLLKEQINKFITNVRNL